MEGMVTFCKNWCNFSMDVSENSGFSPQIIHFNRVFHYFHHPFWDTPMFGNTSMNITGPLGHKIANWGPTQWRPRGQASPTFVSIVSVWGGRFLSNSISFKKSERKQKDIHLSKKMKRWKNDDGDDDDDDDDDDDTNNIILTYHLFLI